MDAPLVEDQHRHQPTRIPRHTARQSLVHPPPHSPPAREPATQLPPRTNRPRSLSTGPPIVIIMEGGHQKKPPQTWVAYLLCLTCGLCGVHHCYLRRYGQATLWGQFLGFGGLGLLRDLVYIPRYIREAQSLESGCVEDSAASFSLARFFAQVVVGAAYALVASTCVFLESDQRVANVLAILGCASGIWLVGNVGQKTVAFLPALLGVVVGLAATKGEIVDNSCTIMAFCGAVVSSFTATKREGTSSFGKMHGCTKLLAVSLAIAVFWAFAIGAFLNIPIQPKSDKMGDFLASTFGGVTAEQAVSAYEVLGVPVGTPYEEVRKAYRAKAREMHPDKNKGPNAEEQFNAVRLAMERLETYTQAGAREIPPDLDPSASTIKLHELLKELYSQWQHLKSAQEKEEEKRQSSSQRDTKKPPGKASNRKPKSRNSRRK